MKTQFGSKALAIWSFCLALFVPHMSMAKTSGVSNKKSHIGGMGKLSTEQRTHRLDHAKELLGRSYKRSVVRTGEGVLKVNGDIYRWTQDALPKKYKKSSKQIAQAIIDQAYKHKLDPIFLMAVIQTESSFNPDLVGGVGEIGLMQIRPETAEWIANKSEIKFQKKMLRDPFTNIQIGAAYLSYLRERFDDHARLYVAAYNMGPSNVKQLLRKDKWPEQYPSRVMRHYVDYYAALMSKQARNEVSPPAMLVSDNSGK